MRLLLAVPMGSLAALGWWVLRANEKDPASHAKLAGRLVGWTLVLLGLAGALVSAVTHARSGGALPFEGTRLPPGHPPVGGAGIFQ